MASALSCSLFFLLLLPCLSVVAQNSGNITVDDSLTAGNGAQAWISPSQDFAFGFHKLEKNDVYLLAIWYNKIPDKTIVWYANGDKPAPTGSKVVLTSDRGLLLTSPQGTEIFVSGVSGGAAAYGLMNDTGNFIIANTGAEKLWQSFDHPTDTLLPGQTMERLSPGQRLETGGQVLSSRLRANNFSRGRFQFRLISDGNAVLNVINMPTGAAYEAYFWSNTVASNSTNKGLRVVFNESGYLYVLRASNERELLTPARVVPTTEYYHRVTLNFDGVMVQYSYPKNSTGNGNWSIVRTMPDNICTDLTVSKGTGPCGFNGICQLSLDQRPICRCPQRFSLLDPNDEYGDCKPDFNTQFCEEELEGVSNSLEDHDFVELINTDWPTSDYEMYKPYNVEECKKACSQDCFCNVIVSREDNCWKKKLPLSNGRQDGNLNGRALIKIRKSNYTIRGPPLPFPNTKKDQDSLLIAVSVLLGGSVFVNFILVGVVSFYFFFLYQKKILKDRKSCRIQFTLLQL